MLLKKALLSDGKTVFVIIVNWSKLDNSAQHRCIVAYKRTAKFLSPILLFYFGKRRSFLFHETVMETHGCFFSLIALSTIRLNASQSCVVIKHFSLSILSISDLNPRLWQTIVFAMLLKLITLYWILFFWFSSFSFNYLMRYHLNLRNNI